MGWKAIVGAAALAALPFSASAQGGFDFETVGKAACQLVATLARAPEVERQKHFLTELNGFDVDLDGRLENVKRGYGGTIGGEPLEILDTETKRGKRYADVGADNNNPTGPDTVLLFRGRAYFVHFRDSWLDHPDFVTVLAPNRKRYRLCDFTTRREKTLTPIAGVRNAREICREQQYGTTDNDLIPVSTPAQNVPADIRNREHTEVQGSVRVDFDNDGTEETLILLRHSPNPTAGRPCMRDYFDLVSADGNSAASGPVRNLLFKLQGVAVEESLNAQCNALREPRWYRRDGVTYFVDSPDWRYKTKASEFHVVARVYGAKIDTVCDASFTVTTKIEAMYPTPAAWPGAGRRN